MCYEAFSSWFLRFLSPPLIPCHNSSARFPEVVRSLLWQDLLLMISCAAPGITQWNILTNTQFASIYNGSDGFFGFLNFFLVF